MVRQVDGSIYYWPGVVSDAAAALLRWCRFGWQLSSQVFASPKKKHAHLRNRFNRLRLKTRQLECENRLLVDLCDQLVEQRDLYYYRYLEAIRIDT